MATLLLKRSLFKFTSACLGLDSEIVKIAFDHPNIDLADSFKAYDVRGIDEQTLNSDVALAVGFAFVEVTGVDQVLVGGDMRPSSPDYVAAFTRGATAAGADVGDLGLISTDMLYHASGVFDATGVALTATHSPAGYKGINMTRSSAVPISLETGLAQIQTVAQTYLDAGYRETDRRGTATHRETLSDEAGYLRDLLNLSKIRPL